MLVSILGSMELELPQIWLRMIQWPWWRRLTRKIRRRGGLSKVNDTSQLTSRSPYDTEDDTFGLDPAFKRTAAFSTYQTFAAPRRHFLDCAIKNGFEDIWTYSFNEPALPPVPKLYGAFHGVDLNYLFGSCPFGGLQFNQTDDALTKAEMTYWLAFTSHPTYEC